MDRRVRHLSLIAHLRCGPQSAVAWCAVALLLVAGALVLRPTTAGAPNFRWDWQPALAWSEPWRWWTAAWLHWSPQHLTLNLMGLAALLWLGWRARMPARAACAWALAWPLTQLLLVLQPALLHYAGLSGVVHAGVAVIAVFMWHRDARERRFAIWLGAGLLLKLLTEHAWTSTTQSVAGWNFELAPMAHVTGTAAGVLCSAWLTRCVTSTPHQDDRGNSVNG